MSNTFKPLALEDFGLSKEELQTVVDGSQKFLPPAVGDDEDKTFAVDAEENPPTS